MVVLNMSCFVEGQRAARKGLALGEPSGCWPCISLLGRLGAVVPRPSNDTVIKLQTQTHMNGEQPGINLSPEPSPFAQL